MKIVQSFCLVSAFLTGFSWGKDVAAPKPQKDQVQGNDILELSETKKGGMHLTSEKLRDVFAEAKKLSAHASEVLNKLNKPYDEFTKKKREINEQTDTFFQESSVNKGKIEGRMSLQSLSLTTTTTDLIEGPTSPDLALINQIIEDIRAGKRTLNGQADQLDEQLNQARALAAAIHKNSFSILSKGAEADAQATLESIKKDLSNLVELETAITGTFGQASDKTIIHVQDLIQQGQELIKKMQEQSASVVLKEASTTTSAQKIVQPVAQEQPVQRDEAKGFAHKIMDGIASLYHDFTAACASVYQYFFPSK